ncbi:hypothetical protein [uncultured Desulfovibrio sp.]|uniref:hypothetical protein n=1 Tax=uncultured Desulfovibrio sp. TaxID=167968 RepID=UPI002636F11D|nr:hypothetical protein [uncultured Desulfovibrio sp.]
MGTTLACHLPVSFRAKSAIFLASTGKFYFLGFSRHLAIRLRFAPAEQRWLCPFLFAPGYQVNNYIGS